MSNTIDKQKLVEWWDKYPGWTKHAFMKALESGAFDTSNNHLRFPRQENGEGGWTISTNFLYKISNRLDDKCEELADEIPSWEQIEMVLLELESLNTSVTEPKCKSCDGEGVYFTGVEHQGMQEMCACPDCYGTGEEVTEPCETCEECAGWGEVVYDDTFGMSQSTPCRKCKGTGRVAEPSVDRVREQLRAVYTNKFATSSYKAGILDALDIIGTKVKGINLEGGNEG